MSITSDSGPWAAVPEWVLDSGVSDRSLRLYALLGIYADKGTGECKPSRSTLAKRLKCSADSVDRAKRELLGIGALRWRQRTVPGKQELTSNEYVLVRISPSEVAADTRLPSRTDAATGSRTGAAENQNQSEPEPISSAAKRRSKNGVVLPRPFDVTEEMWAWASSLLSDEAIELETENFVDHYIANGQRRLDWNASWRTWMRNAKKFREPRRQKPLSA